MSLGWLLLAVSSLGCVSPLFIQTPNTVEVNSEPSFVPQPFLGLFDYTRDSFAEPMSDKTVLRDSSNKARRYHDSNSLEYPGHADIDRLDDLIHNNTSTYILEPQRVNPIKSKRDAEDHWQLRRSNFQEPNMPKRVRFSPWGGKRAGQMILKPNPRAAQVLFSAISDLNDKGVYQLQFPHLNGFEPFRFMAMTKQMDHGTMREAMPYKTFFDLPKLFRTGHPYLDLDLNKIGKRKVKFSTWGGKRAPPIIGPLWFPTSEESKDTALNTLILVKRRDKKSSGDVSLVNYT